jgi:sugar lactone lactonase YvrE
MYGVLVSPLPPNPGVRSIVTATQAEIYEVAYPVHSPNGIGLSPDGSILYYAETHTGRVFRRRVAAPGVRTAYLTLSATGRLASMEWPRCGLRLAHQ